MGRIVICPALVLFLLACGDSSPPDTADSEGEKPVVYTTFYPTTWMVERLAGGFVDVVCPLPDGKDAIFWQPDDKTLVAYRQADLVVVNGAEFEKWVLTTSLPESRVVDSAASLAEDLVRYEDAIEHSHGPAGKHAHEGVDGHTWVDPLNAKAQAATIRDRLKKLLPDRAGAIDANFAKLSAELDGLHEDLARMTEAYEGEAIYASHPAYNYLRKRHGWNVVNLDLDPEAMPSEETMEEIRASLEEKPARFILWESEPTTEIATAFADRLGLTSLTFSPCETAPAEGADYLSVMRRNLKALEPALRAERE